MGYLRVSTQLYYQRRSKSKISFKCTLENYTCNYNPFEWHLKTDGSTGIHVMLMAFSHFLNDVIITYGNTEAISHLLNTNMLPPVLRFLTVTFRTSPVFRTVFSLEVKVVFFFVVSPQVVLRMASYVNPGLAPLWRLKTMISMELWG